MEVRFMYISMHYKSFPFQIKSNAKYELQISNFSYMMIFRQLANRYHLFQQNFQKFCTKTSYQDE